MNLLTKDNELVSFINEKKYSDVNIDCKKLYYYYSKIIKIAYIKSYIRLENYKYSKICADIIENVFWIIFQYSVNIKLSMFLCERAILLYIEYISIYREKTKMDELKLFIYDKTIGPLIIGDFKIKKENGTIINKNKVISSHCENLNTFFYHVLTLCCNNEEEFNRITDYFDSILGVFAFFPSSKIFYKVLFNKCVEYKMPILTKINIIYIVTHIFYIKNKNYEDLTRIDRYMNNINLSEINKYFDNISCIEECDVYNTLYNYL